MQQQGLIRIADLTHAEQNALDELVAQWRQKRSRNNLRSAFYDMKNSEHELMSRAVPEVVKRRRFVLGWSAIAVDKLNRRCNLDGFYAPDGTDLDSLGLGELMRANRLLQEVSMAGKGSLKHSVAWLVATQGDTAAGEPDALLTARDATSGTGMWNVRTHSLRSFLSITDTDGNGEPVGMTMYLPNLNVVMTKEAGAWKVDRREHIYGVPVDPLVYQPDLDRRFGRSRISRTVMSLHVQALAAMIRADVNGEAYSLPRYVLLGATESAFQNADGSPKSTWEAAWDAVWAISDDDEAVSDNLARADVKQFSGQSPEPQNAHLRMLAQMFSGETGIPIGELGIIGDANPTSAEALTVSRDDLVMEAKQTVRTWSADVSSSVTRLLRMMNRGDVPADLDVRCQWANPVTVSPAGAADAATKTFAALPWLAETEVGLEMAGLGPDQIRRALAEKRRAQGRAVLESLTAAGDADAE